MTKYFFILIYITLSITSFSQSKSDDIVGVWQTGGADPAQIQIEKVNNLYIGKITWLQFPEDGNGIKRDRNNPDKRLQDREVVGIRLLSGFKFVAVNSWTGGSIYDPESGKTYNCKISLKDANTMQVRGFIGISLFGRTEVWKRAKK
jgi:uncharacterized protein (DUF2147 family)